MALKQLNLVFTVDELMQKARDSNFTRSGEIFDGIIDQNKFIRIFTCLIYRSVFQTASYLHSLAKSYWDNCSLEKLENEQDESRLFDFLVANKQVVIAYDCDFNFEPTFKQGKKAHWALITGIFAPIDIDEEDIDKDSIVDLNTRLPSQQQDAILERLKASFRDTNKTSYRGLVYSIGKQGKSSQYGVWCLRDLVLSNRQLSFIDDEKINDDMFVKPTDRDLKRTLASQYIVFN